LEKLGDVRPLLTPKMGHLTASQKVKATAVLARLETMESKFEDLITRCGMAIEDIHKLGVDGTSKDANIEELDQMTLEDLQEQVEYWENAKK